MSSSEDGLISVLPEALSERIVRIHNPDARRTGEIIVYWVHHALRAHDNPALDVARLLSANLNIPLLVYQGLGGSHPFANDRHARFAIEAARDLRKQLRSKGGDLAFFSGRDGGESSPLSDLIGQAAVTVTDYMPAPPFDRWPEGVSSGQTLIEIDASCLVPVTLSSAAPSRAFEFRRQFSAQRDERLARGYESIEVEHPWAEVTRYVDSVDLDTPLDDLVHHLPCDHTVGPIADTPGGSTAGYERWRRFRDSDLARYARDRNDAAKDSVSRMSPYLHYGCVSVFQVAREALRAGVSGSEKFLDELLIWRELSYHWAHHCPDVHSADALPAWAVETLRAHEGRESELTTWDLEYARSGSDLWDLAQRSLLERGELHNNVRMTWGKALVQWSPDVESTMHRLTDFNHRYALDGSDPNSYGGLWWCLGLFDRPFKPGRGALGEVRSRSVEAHEKRLDLDAYGAKVQRMPRKKVLVMGAGMAGVTAAHALHANGHRVTLVDKGRGPGGRMSTRRRDSLRFDHGAQYFTARDPRFLRAVSLWQEQGWIDRYEGRIGSVGQRQSSGKSEKQIRWVGVPGMNAVCAGIASTLPDARFETHVTGLVSSENGVTAEFKNGQQEPFDMVVCALPAPQAASLADAETASRLSRVAMHPVWAVMLEAPGGTFPWDAAFINDDGPLSWVMANDSKPGRAQTNSTWTLHATVEWTRRHLENDKDDVARALVAAFAAIDGVEIYSESMTASAHRWLYARGSAESIGEPVDPTGRVVYCGDWARGERVEGAYLSGAAAAGLVMNSRFTLGR